MSGKVTISTFYCIVSTSFYRLLFSKKAVLKHLLSLVSAPRLARSSLHLSCDVERRGKESPVPGNTTMLWSSEANLVFEAGDPGYSQGKKSEELGVWDAGRCSLTEVLHLCQGVEGVRER